MINGSPVANTNDWWSKRRPELRALFEHYMYGQLPAAPNHVETRSERIDRTYFGGKATKKEVALFYASTNLPPLHLLIVLPNRRSGPAPVVVGLNFCANYSVLDDPTISLPDRWMPNHCPGCTNNAATEAGRGRDAGSWAIEQVIDRGYAVATLYNGDSEPDRPGAPDGIRRNYPSRDKALSGPHAWGAIAAWAWSLHRAVDYVLTDRDLDSRRIAVFGHSRNGKAALLAGAFDDRISLVIPHQAGCGGSAPSRGKIGESVKQINDRFPHWFNDTFKEFNEQPERLPFDQHALVALCAPRPVLFSNATEDSWANPAGQFEVLQAADKVYRFLGGKGLEAASMPEPGRLIDSPLGYYIRPGRHSTTAEDWKVFLDFADRHWGKP